MTDIAGSIYLTTNKVNGKVYVGQTFGNSPYYLGGGILINKALKEEDKKNFYKIILVDDIKSPDLLNYLEKFYIKVFNSNNQEIGYNIREGGENRAFKHNPESIEKIRQRSSQDDNRIRIRKIQKIASANRIGHRCSMDIKVKSMITKFGFDRKIEIYDKHSNELLYTCKFSPEASSITGVKRSAISNNLLGLSKSAGNYIFKYKILE